MTAELSANPFPGLRPFEADEHDLFFGREGQSEEILRRLREQRLVAVVGTSGSGKSSLVRAGLLPYLHGGFLPDAGSQWCVALFRPGANPIENLAIALDAPAALGQAPQAVSALRAENGASASSAPQGAAVGSLDEAAARSTLLLEVTLRRGGLGLIEAVQLARLPSDRQLLIVVDQFEEVFRFAEASDRPGRNEDAAAFVKLLLEASRQRELPIYVVITMRSDYIGDCARYRDLPEAVTSGLYLIPRMTREQWRAAIIEPVRVGRGTIAPRLVVRLLNDVGDDPDQLPILQHALMRMWDHWKSQGNGEHPIDIDDYLAIGGMAGALSMHADEAYDALPDDRARVLAERLFKALSEKGADNREVRRPTKLDTLAKVVDAPFADLVRVIDHFRAPENSFLTPAAGVLSHDDVIDISHESLIRGWRRMRQWVESEAESASVYRRLADTASLYGQDKAGLLPNRELENVLAWHDREHPNAAWGERYHPGFEQAMAFLEKSRLAHDAERSRRQTARRRVQFVSVTVTAVIAIIAAAASWQWYNARIEADRARQALAMATGIANSLVFELGQNPRGGLTPLAISPTSSRSASGITPLPPDLARRLFDRAIRSYTELIALNPTAEAFNGRAAAYFDEGDFDNAISNYNEAIALYRQYAVTFNNRGLAYHAKGDYDRAIADYDQAIALDAKNAAAYYSRGSAYRTKGDYGHAFADLDQAIALDPKFAAAYYSRGLAYHAKGDYDHAIADLDQAIALDAKYADVYLSRGLAYHDKGDYDRAIADYAKVIELDSKDPSPLINRSISYSHKGDYNLAIADLNNALQLCEKGGCTLYGKKIAFTWRGRAFGAEGDYDHAIADFDQAIALDPKFAIAYHNRGLAYHAKGDYDHAIADYDQAIALDAKNAAAYYSRGSAYLTKGDYGHALADLDQAIALDAKNAAAYHNRGLAYHAKGDYDRAIADYDQAIALDAKNAAAYNNRGLAYRAKDDYDHAIADYDQAIALDPKYAAAYNNRGRAYDAKDDYDRAIADYDQAIALDPKYATAYNNRCWLRATANRDLTLALSDCDAAMRLAPDDADSIDSRGFVYLRLNRLDEAIADYDAALKLNSRIAASLYGRGIAKQKKGDQAGGDADIAAAKAINATIADEFAKYGVN
jgi:tetratricopeptide (TPR) repeat protein